MGDRFLRILCYADDAIIVAKSEDDLQLYSTSSKQQQKVMGFNYLGVETSSDRYLANEAMNAGKQSSQNRRLLRDIVWRNKYMSTDDTSETRAEISRVKKMMRTTEMRILRVIKGPQG
ncbi:hypothetical protein ACFW04_002210 [Cataglyphis niger]